MRIFEKVSYDKEADACYISVSKNKISKTEMRNERLVLDKDNKWNLIGIEVLNAKSHMKIIEKILLSQWSLEQCVLS